MYSSANGEKSPPLSPENQAILDSLVNPDTPRNEPERFTFDQDLQRSIIGRVLESKDFFAKNVVRLNPEYFTADTHRTILALVRDYHGRYGDVPTVTVLRNLLTEKYNKADDDERHAKLLSGHLAEVFTLTTHFRECQAAEECYLQNAVEQFAERQAARGAVRATLDALQKGVVGPALRKAVAESWAAAQSLMGPDTSATEPEIRIYDRDELDALPSPTWLINQHLPVGGFGIIYGPYGSCKSFLALEAALAIANNKDFLGRFKTRPGKVVYIAAEGHTGMVKRIKAWELDRQVGARTPKDRFALIPDAFSMLAEGKAEAVAALVQRKLGDVDLVICDTLARLMEGGDENSTKDMSAFVAGSCRLGKLVNATTAVLHHTGKDSGRGARGSVSLGGACDFMIETIGEAESEIRIRCEKAKDSAKFQTYRLAADVVQLVGEESSLVLNWKGLMEEGNGDDDKHFLDHVPLDPGRITAKDLKAALGWKGDKKFYGTAKRLVEGSTLRHQQGTGSKPTLYWRVPS